MNATEQNDDNNGVEQDSLTHPPLLDKEIDMFSETNQNDDKNACSTPPKPVDDPAQDTPNHIPKKMEPVLGKERAIKILKAFGSQQKPVKEFFTNVLKTPTRDNNKPKREKSKSLTPLEKAKETISQIEELKKFKDRTIPTYFGENVVIHHIKVEHPPTETKLDKSENVEKISKEIVGPKIPVDSLEALKVYNNLDVDKPSEDEDVNSEKSEKEEPLMSSDLLDSCLKKRKLSTSFDSKAKRAKDKRSKRISQDSRGSDKKRQRRNKDRRKRRTRDASSRRSSTSSSKKRSRKRRDSNREVENSSERRIPSDKRISSEKRNSLDRQGRDPYERYTKTLPAIKYSPNPLAMRRHLPNGVVDKISASKKKKRSSSKSTTDKRKRTKSSDGSAEKLKLKRRRRSGSKADKSDKKRRRDSHRSVEDVALKIKSKKLSPDNAPLLVNSTVDGKSPNSEEYHSNWDNYDSVDATDEMRNPSSLENLLQLDTIPLQLNVPKQDRTILYMNDCCAKISEQINQTTPRMDRSDPTMETPIIVDTTAAKINPVVLSDLENGKFSSPLTCSVSTPRSDNSLDKYISKISPEKPITKRNDQPILNHQPIARLYDEYEQFIMSCVPAPNENQSNGDKSSVTSSLFESVTSNDGDEELEALKKSLEMKLHEIEHTDSDDTVKLKVVTEEVVEAVKVISPEPPPNEPEANESSDSSESSSSSSSSDSSSSSSSSDKKQRKKKTRKQNAKLPITLDENMFDLKPPIEDDELSDNELLSKVQLLKQQFSEKRKEIANKRKLVANDVATPESVTKTIGTDALLVSPERRSAISLKIGSNKPNSIMKPVMFDDDDFTEKLMLEVTPTTINRSKETYKSLIEPGVGLVSNNKPIISDIFPKSNKPTPLEDAIVKIAVNERTPTDASEMKKYLNNTSSQLDSSDSFTSKTSGSIESSKSPAENRKSSPTRQSTPISRTDKRDQDSKHRSHSPYSRSRTKESSKRYSSPPPRHRSPRSRKRSYRSPSPIRKRSRGSPRRSRSPRKSPRRASPRRMRRSLSPRSKRTVSPLRGRPRTPPMPEKHTSRQWEPPHTTDYSNSTKGVLACDNNAPQPICRLETTHTTPWPDEGNSAFAQYNNYQPIRPLSPKRTIEDRNTHTFNHSDQSYDFHQASGPYMGHVQYSTENTSKIPVLNSQENYYFQPHIPQALPPQPIPTTHMPRHHAPPMHVSHITPNQLSNQTLSVQHPPPPPPPPQQRLFSNLIEIRQSNVDVERTPFVLKGNVLEIVPKTEAAVVEQAADLNVEDENCYDKQDVVVELTEEEIERREVKKAELKLKRKQERDKRHLERFMRKEKLKLEIKHLMEVSVHTADVKKATYNPNAVGGKSILRGNASSANKKSVLFADGIAPGDGTSTSEREDVAPLLRDRNKRMTKKKLDSKRRRARREASIIKKDTVPQVLEITPFVDPEIENMPPPPPPDGNPPPRLAQPKLKSTPKLIYFHYDFKNNTMCISPFPTDVNIPSYPSNDSPPAASTPDLIPKPKVCFIQPPAFEPQPAPVQAANSGAPNQNSSAQNNFVGATESPTTVPPPKPFNQQHQQPLHNSHPSSPALYPSRQVQSPQNFRGPPPIINQQSVPSQPPPMQIQPSPMQIQPSPMPIQPTPIPIQPTPMPMQQSPMASQWDNFPPNPQIMPIQQPSCAQSWEPDIYPHNQAIRPHIRFNNGNNVVQPRPVHNLWEQQRHANPLYQNQMHSPQQHQQPPPPQAGFLPRPNHPRFHPNQPVHVNGPHNNFAFNSKYNYNANPSHTWNNQYRNNH